MAGPPLVTGEQHQGMEPPAQNATQRGWKTSLGLRYWIEKSCSLSHSYTRICSYLHFGSKFWSWRQNQFPTEEDGWDFHPAALPTNPGSCTLERTDSDGQCSGQGSNAKREGPLLDSSSSNSLWKGEAMLTAPQTARSWRRRDAFTTLREQSVDPLALIKWVCPSELSKVGHVTAPTRTSLAQGAPAHSRTKLGTSDGQTHGCTLPSTPVCVPGGPQNAVWQSRSSVLQCAETSCSPVRQFAPLAVPTARSKAGGTEGSCNKTRLGVSKRLFPLLSDLDIHFQPTSDGQNAFLVAWVASF